jgi:hypothetical protein
MSEYSSISLLGIVAVGLLWIGVSNRYMLKPVTCFAILMLLALPAMEFLNDFLYLYNIPQLWVYFTTIGVASVGLIITYTLRFLKGNKRDLVSYLKLSAIILNSVSLLISGLFGSQVFLITFLIYLCLVYYYDRLVLPSPHGNKKYMIAMSLMGVLCILFLVYALVQRTQAMRQREIAVELQKQAEENEKKALEAQAEAAKQAEIAREQAELARRTLEEFKKGN